MICDRFNSENHSENNSNKKCLAKGQSIEFYKTRTVKNKKYDVVATDYFLKQAIFSNVLK